MESPSCSSSLFEHDLFGKPVSTFPDHALARVPQSAWRSSEKIILNQRPRWRFSPIPSRSRKPSHPGLSLPFPAVPDIRCATHLWRLRQRRSQRFAAIAQLVEHVIRNDGVGGSNPSCGTNQIKHLEHDPEKWKPVFPRDKRGTRLRGDHAQTKS